MQILLKSSVHVFSLQSCKRTPSGPEKSVRLREVSTLYVAGTMPKCPPTGGVRLQEVSVSGGSTVSRFFKSSNFYFMILFADYIFFK